MWNHVHTDLLRLVIDGTWKLTQFSGSYPVSLSQLCELNRQTLSHTKILTLKRIDETNLDDINRACECLFEEFAQIIGPAELQSRLRMPARIDEKLTALTKACIEPPQSLTKAWEIHSRLKVAHKPIDCLFVTALPVEFYAIVRRIHHFSQGTDPKFTRGFVDEPIRAQGASIHPGWVHGYISHGRNTVSLLVICTARYGPVGAALATLKILQTVKPKIVIVVGIAASLGESSQLDLGDIGVSSGIVDITLGKDTLDETNTLDETMVSFVPVTGEPDWNKVPAILKDKLSEWIEFKDAKIFLKGILPMEDAKSLRNAFENETDQSMMLKLSEISYKRVETTDLTSKAVSIECPNTAIMAADQVAKKGVWVSGIHLFRPDRELRVPQVKPTIVLSGSRVVKQYGMRGYLKQKFPEALLVEMEGAGAANACKEHAAQSPPLIPTMIVKSAVDWADPKKADTWHPYCADGVAAFAIELALQLVHLPRNSYTLLVVAQTNTLR
jgi:nucleoside phosphorylase